MDFVTAWKAVSIALTGAFGILGLLKDFKDKDTNKVTLWGRISLIGILVSSICGIGAQLKESQDDARNTRASLHNIERMLSPLAIPRVYAVFEVNCMSEGADKDFCEPTLKDSKWRNLDFTVAVFSSAEQMKLYERDSAQIQPDLWYTLDKVTGERTPSSAFGTVSDIELRLQDLTPAVKRFGRLTSIEDLYGAHFLIDPHDLEDVLIPSFLRFSFENGQRVTCFGSFVRTPISAGHGTKRYVYEATFSEVFR